MRELVARGGERVDPLTGINEGAHISDHVNFAPLGKARLTERKKEGENQEEEPRAPEHT